MPCASYTAMARDEEVELLMQRFNAAVEKTGFTPRPEIMLLRHTYVGGDLSDVENAASSLSRFFVISRMV